MAVTKFTTKSTTPLPGRLSLGSQILQCSNCELCNGNEKPLGKKLFKTNLPKGLYLFVDETPNDIESVVGEPMTGSVGSYFKTFISPLLPPEKYLVVNQVICYTESEKVTQAQRKSCFQNFELVVDTVKPKLIFALGSSVSKFLIKQHVQHIQLPNKYEIFMSDLAKARTKLLLQKHV
jgi:uracil-DNA glycosylase family 4